MDRDAIRFLERIGGASSAQDLKRIAIVDHHHLVPAAGQRMRQLPDQLPIPPKWYGG